MASKVRTTGWADWFLFGHFWIALTAAGLAWTSGFLTTGEGKLQNWHALVFLGTLALYNWHRIFSFSRIGAIQDAPRYVLVLFYPILSRIIASLASIGCLILAFTLALPWPIISIGLLLAAGYILPLDKSGSGWLRKSYIKPLVVATGWMIVTAALPLFYTNQLSGDWGTSLILTERFGYTLCVAICFDWRDRKIDRLQGVNTLAQWPLAWSKIAAALSITIALTCCLILFRLNRWDEYTSAMIPCYLLAFILIVLLGKLKGDYKFAWLYNGILALPPLFIWILILIPKLRSALDYWMPSLF